MSAIDIKLPGITPPEGPEHERGLKTPDLLAMAMIGSETQFDALNNEARQALGEVNQMFIDPNSQYEKVENLEMSGLKVGDAHEKKDLGIKLEDVPGKPLEKKIISYGLETLIAFADEQWHLAGESVSIDCENVKSAILAANTVNKTRYDHPKIGPNDKFSYHRSRSGDVVLEQKGGPRSRAESIPVTSFVLSPFGYDRSKPGAPRVENQTISYSGSAQMRDYLTELYITEGRISASSQL